MNSTRWTQLCGLPIAVAIVISATVRLFPGAAVAQVLEQPRGFVAPDLGPAGRPTGVPPNSGLAPGRQAFPPGDPNALGPGGGKDSLRLEPPKLAPAPIERPAARAARHRPPALPRPSGSNDD